MHFSSDNASGVAPEIMAALARANEGPALAYGADALTRGLTRRFSELFEREVAVFPVATGTAANALILSELCPPWGAVLCHRVSHINLDEGGAPEMMTGGAKLIGVEGADGRLTPEGLAAALEGLPRGGVHHAEPAVLSLTQSTECGTVYAPETVAALSDAAHAGGLAVHMDGARFANAVAALGISPAEATWRLGIDALSFGATKNGALAAEAAVFFDPARAATFERRRKRAGHLLSKLRFVSAQLDAYVADGLWLRLAAHANRMAAELAEGIGRIPGAALVHPVEANEVFVRINDRQAIARLRDSGASFAPWDPVRGIVRLVASFQTTPGEVRQFLAALRKSRPAGPGEGD